MSRHSLTPSAATDRHGICERRSLCYIVPSRPCLKLTGKPPDCHLPESSQAIEGMHDFAVSARVPGRRPVLYRGAGLADGLDDVPGGAGWDAAPSHSAAPCPSVVPTLAVPFKSMPGRGGARNRADRRTLAISKTAARALIEATLFAEAAGMPFNRFTTIHWQAACVADGLLASRQFLKRLANLTRSNGGRFACIWIRENGDSKGEHVHILWHGPNDLPKLGRWIRATLKTCGATRRRGVCLIRDCIAAFWGAAFGMVGVIWALSKWTPNAKPKIIAVEFWLICAGLLAFELLYMPASWDRLPALISVAVSASGALILFKIANGHEEYPVSVTRTR